MPRNKEKIEVGESELNALDYLREETRMQIKDRGWYDAQVERDSQETVTQLLASESL